MPEVTTEAIPSPPIPDKRVEVPEKSPKVTKPKPKKPPRRTQAIATAARAEVAAAPKEGLSAESNRAQATWRDALITHLQRNKRYPADAQARRAEGTVVLSFTMDRNGRVLTRRIVHGSGVSELDGEALALIQRAQPLPAFPPAMTQAQITLSVPLRFSLR
jgi:protein TonB